MLNLSGMSDYMRACACGRPVNQRRLLLVQLRPIPDCYMRPVFHFPLGYYYYVGCVYSMGTRSGTGITCTAVRASLP